MHYFKSILLLHFGALTMAKEVLPTPAVSQPQPMEIRAINPTKSGQIGINPVDVYYQTTTMMPDQTVPSRPVIHDGATTTMGAPFAVVTEADGDIVFPVNPASKAALQALFDEVTFACGSAKKKIRKRSGQCELDYFSRPGVGGGILDFDFDALSIPLFTMGDISVALQSYPGAVAVAFLAYALGNGKVVEDVAPKEPKTTASTSEDLVPTTTREDIPDSLFTADPAVYEAMAAKIRARIALGDPEHLWSDDQTEIPTADCDRSKLLNVESKVIKDLSAAFCDKLDFKKVTSRDLTNKDANTNLYADYKFNMKWEPKAGSDCHDLDCEALYSTFASTCQYNSHSMYTSGAISTDCGTASFSIQKSAPPSITRPPPAPSGTVSCGQDSPKIATDSISGLLGGFCGGRALEHATVDASHPSVNKADIPNIMEDHQVLNNVYVTLMKDRPNCGTATFDLGASSSLCQAYIASITASCPKEGGVLTSAGCFDWGVKAFTVGEGGGSWSTAA